MYLLNAYFNNQHYYGYKNHAKVDAGSKLIAGYEITDASVHDSQALDALLDKKQDKEQELYAESAYADQQKNTRKTSRRFNTQEQKLSGI